MAMAVIPDCRAAASPESIFADGPELSQRFFCNTVVMDSGLALRAPRNDEHQNKSKYSFCSHAVTSLPPLASALKRVNSASLMWA